MFSTQRLTGMKETVQEYLARGGKIEQVAIGVTGDKWNRQFHEINYRSSKDGPEVEEMNLTYDGSDKAKELLIQMADMVYQMDGEIELEVVTKAKKRTNKQNNSLHLWLDMLSKELNSAGLEQRKIIDGMREGFDIPWSTYSAKEWLYKPILEAKTGKTSTTELDTVEPSEICDILGKHLAEKYGITPPPFPSIESQMRKAA